MNLLICGILFIRLCLAQINIQLQANWENPPFELRLIETVASENETYYLNAVSKIAGFSLSEDDEDESDEIETYGDVIQTDEELYNSVFDLLTPLEKSLYQIPLANKYYSPRIISHYKYYNESVLPQFKTKLLKKCGAQPRSWFLYNNVVYCDPEDVYALLTDKSADSQTVLSFDRVIGTEGPLLVLYGDVKDSKFTKFIDNLYQSSKEGKFRFVWRYVPQQDNFEREKLSGYGVDLTLKRTDYIVIDDRELSNGKQEVLGANDIHENNDLLFLNVNQETIEAFSKSELEDLDLRLSSFVLSSNNDSLNFDTLLKVVEDLPKFAASLSGQPIDQTLVDQSEYNTKVGLTPENSAIFVNGLALDEAHQTIFGLYQKLKEEVQHVTSLKELGLTSESAKHAISKFALLSLFNNPTSSPPRYQIESEDSPVIYFNDIETDSLYDDLDDDISVYLRRHQFGQVPLLRQNLHTVVFAIHLSDLAELQVLKQVLEAVTANRIPQRVGIIPLVESDDDRILANNLYHIVKTTGVKKASRYLKKLGLAKAKVLTDDDYVSEYVNPFLKRFNLKSSSVIVNGVFYDFDDNWPYALTRQVSDDVNRIARLVYNQKVTNGVEAVEELYKDTRKLRNTLAVPDDKSLYHYKVIQPKFFHDLKSSNNKIFEVKNGKDGKIVTITFAGGLGSQAILEQLAEILEFSAKTDLDLKLRIVDTSEEATFIGKIRQSLNKSIEHAIEVIEEIIKEHEFVQFTTNGAVKNLLKTIDIDSDNFILLNGRYLDLNGEFLDEEILDYLVDFELRTRIGSAHNIISQNGVPNVSDVHDWFESFSSVLTKTYFLKTDPFSSNTASRFDFSSVKLDKAISLGDKSKSDVHILLSIDPAQEISQKLISLVDAIKELTFVSVEVVLQPQTKLEELPIKRFYRGNHKSSVEFKDGQVFEEDYVRFDRVPEDTLFTLDVDTPQSWIVVPKESPSDLDNVLLKQSGPITGIYELRNIIIEGNAFDIATGDPPTGLAVEIHGSDTNVMTNYGYFQLKAGPGLWDFNIKSGKSSEIYSLLSIGDIQDKDKTPHDKIQLSITSLDGPRIDPRVAHKKGKENERLITGDDEAEISTTEPRQGFLSKFWSKKSKQADINIFTIASGHLYERLMSIMMTSVMRHTKHTVKFWLIDNYMSPTFRKFLPHLASKYGFEYELVTYKWPSWLRGQREKQRTIWGYKILFLDVLFPQDLDKVIFVDADQIVRTDMKELVDIDLEGAPYGYTPMGDSREEMEGFRFWKQGYWKKFLGDTLKYHISALYVIDLKKFRQIAAGDRLRQHYQSLSRDPNSLSNLDQDLPNNLQTQLKIFSLPQDWLWCETWCSDDSLKTAKTIDLCNNPLTKEPKLDRARRQIPEWSVYDNEISELHHEIFFTPEENIIDKPQESGHENESPHDEL